MRSEPLARPEGRGVHSQQATAAILACLDLPSRAPPTEPALSETGPTDLAATDW